MQYKNNNIQFNPDYHEPLINKHKLCFGCNKQLDEFEVSVIIKFKYDGEEDRYYIDKETIQTYDMELRCETCQRKDRRYERHM